ncbi:Carboxypeptidase regulatory-like domain-containing protein [Salegentibacter echinorum]|uniref:Carboxypeptidase regulatory-like domain-containing protein n=1 Tax=Salegentibacter echinorum TaxID=1073325 RepID=A0A1M5HMH7_SALEC|nr:TonB-dependent receptor [Salegentibacter echinorum]SHG17137.1 Carboxypeptidase regulatory-like domain-containing protein [Salegentibacter echinorum]
MRIFFSLALLLIATSLTAQSFEINGKVVNPQGTPLESATIYVEKPSDSTLVTYTISDDSGNFQLSGKTALEKVNLLISYAGMQTHQQEIKIQEQQDLGTLKMEIADNTLDEITITSSRAPVTIKKDTLEFNAASFKTRKDANLEELLKELPGVEVATDGSITVNGTPVQKIKVNGKDFFGDDPKIATKNLPKELINKLQVVDSKTKSEEFTGKEGDAENKTINITIDEDKNRGFFSRLTAGGGTDDRYELSGIGNYFKNDLRISVLGSSNNINSSGFTFDEVYDAMGRNAYSISRGRNGFSINGNSFGSGNGITKSNNIGFSFVNEWPQETELSTNYFYNRADNRTESITERENILPDRRYFNVSESSGTRLNDNHRFSMGFEIQPDTLTRISVSPNFVANSGRSSNKAYTESFEADDTPINTALTDNYSEVKSTNFSNRLSFSRKFGEKGGYYSLYFNNQNNTRKQDNNFFSEREVYDDQGNLTRTDIQDQLITEDNKEDNYGVSANARFPLTEKLMLDLSYRFEKEDGRNERLVYEADGDGEYELLDEALSSDFKSESFNHRPSVGLAYNGEKLRANLSGGFQSIRLKNEDLFTNSEIDNTYDNFFASAFARYRMGQGKSIFINYRNSWNTPSLRQLQPVINTINPLNIVVGNPDLKPTLDHRVYVNFNNFDFKTRSGFYAYLSANFTDDKVVARTTVDEDLVRTTTYTNLDGAYNISGGGRTDKTFKLENESSIKIQGGLHGNYSKNVGFTNGEEYNSKSLNLTPNIGLTYNFRDLVTIEPFYSIGFVDAEYSFNKREEKYNNQNVSLAITSYWPEKFIIGSDIAYRNIGNAAPGFQDSFYLWNASLGYELFGENGILKIKVFDLLDQNIATQRFTGDDFIQDTQELVLEQYFMLSFTYKLSKFGGKDPNKKRGRR